MPRNAIYRHANNTDTLYLSVYTDGEWSDEGTILGDHSAEPGKYVFSDLADDTAYEVRIRAGAEPAVSDLAIAPIPVPVVSGGGGSGEADWSAAEREQLRHRLGIDGDRSAPAEAEPVLTVFVHDTVISVDAPKPDEAGLITITQRDDYDSGSDTYPIGPIRIETDQPLLRETDPPTIAFFAKQRVGKHFGKITITGTAYAVAVAGEATQYDLFANLTAAALNVTTGCYGWQLKAIYPAGGRSTLVGGDLQVEESTDLSL